MTTAPMPDDELRQEILKAAHVRAGLLRWETKSGEPIKHTSQPIVEIGIDDLMQLFQTALAKREAEARIDQTFRCERQTRLIDRADLRKKWLWHEAEVLGFHFAPPNKEKGA